MTADLTAGRDTHTSVALGVPCLAFTGLAGLVKDARNRSREKCQKKMPRDI